MGRKGNYVTSKKNTVLIKIKYFQCLNSFTVESLSVYNCRMYIQLDNFTVNSTCLLLEFFPSPKVKFRLYGFEKNLPLPLYVSSLVGLAGLQPLRCRGPTLAVGCGRRRILSHPFPGSGRVTELSVKHLHDVALALYHLCLSSWQTIGAGQNSWLETHG